MLIFIWIKIHIILHLLKTLTNNTKVYIFFYYIFL